jgi:16S rRNA (guanine527-N7)-methyltransferase
MAAAPNSRIGDWLNSAEFEQAVMAAGLPPLPSGTAELFIGYLDILLRWNAKLNLTAVREPSLIVRRHFLECIQCAQALPAVRTLLDFGSGAGLPGIPIAIVRPEIDVTLGESQGKKAAFLREAVRVLGLNANVCNQRVENMAGDSVFGAVTLRAVDRIHDASREAIKRVRPDGWLVLFVTDSTEGPLRSALVELTWDRRIPIVGLEKGFLLFGRKPCST